MTLYAVGTDKPLTVYLEWLALRFVDANDWQQGSIDRLVRAQRIFVAEGEWPGYPTILDDLLEKARVKWIGGTAKDKRWAEFEAIEVKKAMAVFG